MRGVTNDGDSCYLISYLFFMFLIFFLYNFLFMFFFYHLIGDKKKILGKNTIGCLRQVHASLGEMGV